MSQLRTMTFGWVSPRRSRQSFLENSIDPGRCGNLSHDGERNGHKFTESVLSIRSEGGTPRRPPNPLNSSASCSWSRFM